MINSRQLLSICSKPQYFKRNFFDFLKQRNDTCNLVMKGNVSPELIVPENIQCPKYYYEPMTHKFNNSEIEIKSSQQIEKMRQSCKLAAKILHLSGSQVQPGMSTDEIDKFVHNAIISHNAYPSPLRYWGFPKSVCTSVNNVACHGIPDDRKLLDGDIINIDVTTFYMGYHGDCSYTFQVGNVDEKGKFLCKITEECLQKAIKECGPGALFNAIGNTIENHANVNNLQVIPTFIGHGIGEYFHGAPEVYHFRNDNDDIMLPGMTFTIEPILTFGRPDIDIQEDGWTAITVDNCRTAQFEHTILITDDGCEILTQYP